MTVEGEISHRSCCATNYYLPKYLKLFTLPVIRCFNERDVIFEQRVANNWAVLIRQKKSQNG